MPHSQLLPQDFKSSVVAAPPIALTSDFEIAYDQNAALTRHIESGGARILLYGGNANLYHYGQRLYRDALKMMHAFQTERTSVITSIGPDFGKMLDQTKAVREIGLKNVMLLPMAFPADSAGVANGARRVANELGFGVILYIKDENYVHPDELARLIREGVVRFVKYAVDREDPVNDSYLDSILAEVGTDVVASGMGEVPIADHLARRKLATFTSGAVCIAPAAAMELLSLHKSGDTERAEQLAEPFLEFQQLCCRIGSMKVLHDGVSISGVADMGPLLPMVSNITAAEKPEVQKVITGLLEVEKAVLEAVSV
ncbi:MAG TPA: dihydrodipicolinate synthase family protein [Eoetvoesiella sp.]